MKRTVYIPHCSDEELLHYFVKDNNTDALSEIFKRYTSFLFSVCFKYLKSTSSSEDVVMNVFERFMKESKKTNIVTLKPWLYTVAKNDCLQLLRKNKKIESLPLDFVEESSAEDMEFDEELHRMKNEEKVRDAVDSLKTEQQTCIKLFFFENKSYKEIEDITGYTQKNIKSYIQNGRRNLKNIIGSVAVVLLALVSILHF